MDDTIPYHVMVRDMIACNQEYSDLRVKHSQLEADLDRVTAERDDAVAFIDGNDPGHIKHRSLHISEALGIDCQSTTGQTAAIILIRKENARLREDMLWIYKASQFVQGYSVHDLFTALRDIRELAGDD